MSARVKTPEDFDYQFYARQDHLGEWDGISTMGTRIRTPDGQWRNPRKELWEKLADADDADHEQAKEMFREWGVWPLVQADMPAESDTHTYDRSFDFDEETGICTEVWTQRAKNADELDLQDRRADEADLAANALATLDTIINHAQSSTAERELARIVRRMIRSWGVDRS